jgi:hypothetical protein
MTPEFDKDLIEKIVHGSSLACAMRFDRESKTQFHISPIFFILFIHE